MSQPHAPASTEGLTRMDDRRPIPDYPAYTIDREGRVRQAVQAHGRVHQCLVPANEGRVALSGPGPCRAVRVAHTATLMARVWPELFPSEADRDAEHARWAPLMDRLAEGPSVGCGTLDADAGQAEEVPPAPGDEREP